MKQGSSITPDQENPLGVNDRLHRGSHANLMLVTVGSFLGCALLLRYLWSYSLANGDELFFSNGAGNLDSADASADQWLSFMSWLWWEHTGRTADWLSALVYVWGISPGKWIASVLAAASASLIVLCLYQLHIHFSEVSTSRLTFIPLGVLALLFLPAADTLLSAANLTMYSAAVSNYLVPTSLIITILTMVVVNPTSTRLTIASLLGAVAGTLHEQSAAMIIVLVIALIAFGENLAPLRTRVFVSLLPLAGALEMFLSPGLHSKLSKVALAQSPMGAPSLSVKVATSFYGLGVYYPLLIALISITLAITLSHQNPGIRERRTAAATIALSVAFLFTVAAFFLWSSSLTQFAVSASTFILIVEWAVALYQLETHTRTMGFLFFLLAMTSLSIPALSGLSAIRVYNYTILLSLILVLWLLMMLGEPVSPTPCVAPASSTKVKQKSLLVALIIALLSMTGMGKVVVAFHDNYSPGLADLQHQQSACNALLCQAEDPVLPYQRAISGYGDHDYADVERVIEWILAE